MFFSTRSTSCSTRILAFALFPFKEYDVVFPSIFVNSFTLLFKTGDSSFAAHCLAFCLNCSFRWRVCSSDWLLLSACVKKICSPSAMSEEEDVTSIGVGWICSQILRRISSVTLSSSLERRSTAVLTDPAMCAILKLYCNTESHALQSAGGIAFVWKKRVTDLLPVRTLVGFVVCYKMCANSRNAI